MLKKVNKTKALKYIKEMQDRYKSYVSIIEELDSTKIYKADLYQRSTFPYTVIGYITAIGKESFTLRVFLSSRLKAFSTEKDKWTHKSRDLLQVKYLDILKGVDLITTITPEDIPLYLHYEYENSEIIKSLIGG